MVIRGKHLLIAAVVLLVLAGAGTGLWYYLRPTDENLIRGQFAKFAELVTKSGKEGALPAATRAKEISQLFTDRAVFDVDGLSWMAGPFTRKDLSANAFRARAMLERAKLGFDLLEIEVAPDRRTARIFLTASLAGKSKDGRDFREVRELECAMIREDSGWVFDSFKIRRIIRK